MYVSLCVYSHMSVGCLFVLISEWQAALIMHIFDSYFKASCFRFCHRCFFSSHLFLPHPSLPLSELRSYLAGFGVGWSLFFSSVSVALKNATCVKERGFICSVSYESL